MSGWNILQINCWGSGKGITELEHERRMRVMVRDCAAQLGSAKLLELAIFDCFPECHLGCECGVSESWRKVVCSQRQNKLTHSRRSEDWKVEQVQPRRENFYSLRK